MHRFKRAVKLLLKAGANPNLQNASGLSALMMVCRYSRKKSTIETVKLLVETGSNVNLQNLYGYSALMMTCKYGMKDYKNEIIILLLEAGADMNLINKNDETAFNMLDNDSSKTVYQFVKERNEYKKKYLDLEKINQQLQSELKFYKASLDLHPDGKNIMALRDNFYKSL